MGRGREKYDWSDLIGKKFGMLTAVKELPKENWICGNVTILCKCDCGKEKIVRATCLKRGEITSCGCHKFAYDKLKKDLDGKVIGKKFNMLTPIERINNKGSIFLCRCDCGNEVKVRISDVIDGTTKSCGCFQKDGSRKRILERNDLKHFEKTTVSFLESVVDKNHKPAKNNSSGTTGVCKHRDKKGRTKWIAYLNVNKKKIWLGEYDRKEDAITARKNGEEKYFKPVIEKYYNENESSHLKQLP